MLQAELWIAYHAVVGCITSLPRHWQESMRLAGPLPPSRNAGVTRNAPPMIAHMAITYSAVAPPPETSMAGHRGGSTASNAPYGTPLANVRSTVKL